MSTVSLEMTHPCDHHSYVDFRVQLFLLILTSTLRSALIITFYELPWFLPIASELNTAVLIIVCGRGLCLSVSSQGNNTGKKCSVAVTFLNAASNFNLPFFKFCIISQQGSCRRRTFTEIHSFTSLTNQAQIHCCTFCPRASLVKRFEYINAISQRKLITHWKGAYITDSSTLEAIFAF